MEALSSGTGGCGCRAVCRPTSPSRSDAASEAAEIGSKSKRRSIESGDWQDDKTRTHVLSWKDGQTASCEMKLTEFRDFPAFQWVVRLRNDGQTDSAKVHDFWGIDTYWNAADGSMPILHRSVGSPGHEDDFHFMSEIMHNSMWDKRRRIAMDTPTNAQWGQAHAYHIPTDKRSSAIWLPFFNYQTGGDGLITGLGWSGAWRAYFDHQGGGNSTILAGVENFDSILHPGETVRSTLNLALYWQGELSARSEHVPRLVLEHYSPRINGKRVEPPISGVVWGGIPSKEHLDIIEKIKEYEIPLDVYWFDAGWYGTGSSRPIRFSRGIGESWPATGDRIRTGTMERSSRSVTRRTRRG
jgi:hypothetical protein